jgi:thiol-disulfide isomerase/thioredoxin
MSRSPWKSRWLPAGLAAVALALTVAVPSCWHREGETANLSYVLKDMNGEDVNLASFKGRPILLNFWATWCGPCKAEIPWFVDFAEKYKAQRLAVIGISVDDSAEDMRAFAAKYQVNYPLLVGLPDRDLRVQYEANELIPISWLIRADGTILDKAQGVHPREWFEANLQTMFADAD